VIGWGGAAACLVWCWDEVDGIDWMVALRLADRCLVVSVVSVCNELLGSVIVEDIEQLIAEYLLFF